MLKKIPSGQQHALKLADFIEQRTDIEFSMNCWDTCLCGFNARMLGYGYSPELTGHLFALARDKLGITNDVAIKLFMCPSYSNMDRGEAVKLLRDYGWTGRIE